MTRKGRRHLKKHFHGFQRLFFHPASDRSCRIAGAHRPKVESWRASAKVGAHRPKVAPYSRMGAYICGMHAHWRKVRASKRAFSTILDMFAHRRVIACSTILNFRNVRADARKLFANERSREPQGIPPQKRKITRTLFQGFVVSGEENRPQLKRQRSIDAGEPLRRPRRRF